MPKNSSLTLHIEHVDNGFILKNITGKEKGKKPPTKVSTNVAGLKAHIAQTIHEDLLGVTRPVPTDAIDYEKEIPPFVPETPDEG